MIELSNSSEERQSDAFRPRVRGDALVRTYDNEAVAWSPVNAAPAFLDPVASVIFQLLDGTASVADLIADVHEYIGVPEAVAGAQIRRVLDQLDGAGLLTTSAAPQSRDIDLDYFPAPPNP